jgi:aryl-alcohol dehydrogenase-like predicted oxidoreductase
MAAAGRTAKLDDDFTVSAIGFGAGALASVYGDVDDAESLATLNRCLDLGVTFIDTANVYGGGSNERLMAKLLAGRRDEVTLATKFGVAGNPADRAAGRRRVRGDAAYVRQCIDESLARLQADVVDLYYMHRRDLRVPIEETVGAMAELVRAGKVRHLGLCEVTAGELRAAVAVHPIAAVQSEWSIWSRDVERQVVRAARRRARGGLCAVLPAGPRFLDRNHPFGRGPVVAGRRPPHYAPVRRRRAGSQPRGGRCGQVGCRGTACDAGAGRAGVAAVPRRGPRCGLGTDSRHPAGVTRRGEPWLAVGHPDPRPAHCPGRGGRGGHREPHP